jgi:mannitol/fructose-specific phosphotransferase system IIA component (Ntr-type)
MKLSDILDPAAIRVPLTATGKEQAIRELVDLLESTHQIDSMGEIWSRVIARESMVSTGIGHGVAVPHAKARSVRDLVASCGVVPDGIDYDSLDGAPVKLLVLIVSPEAERGPHVRVLAAISRLMIEKASREALIGASDAETFWSRLLAAEEELERTVPEGRWGSRHRGPGE